MNPPIASKKPKDLTIHGYTRTDSFYWLNDRTDQEVIDYLIAENEYTETELKSIEPLKSEIYQEIIGRIKQKDDSVPFKWRRHYYQSRYDEWKEYPIYGRSTNEQMDDFTILLDANELAKGKAFYQIGGYEVSPDNKLIAYSEDTISRRIYTICFKDIASGKILDWKIPQSSGSVYWSNDSKFLYYVEIDATTLRPHHVKRWSLEEPEKEPVSVFIEGDETYYVGIKPSISGRYLFIESDSTLTSEVQIIDLDNPSLAIKTFYPRQTGHEYSVEHGGKYFYVKTNIEGRNFCLKKCTEPEIYIDNWETVVPHHPERLFEDFTVINDRIIIQDRYNANSYVKVIGQNECYEIPFSEDVYLARIGTNADYESNFIRLTYTSLTTPMSIYDFDFTTKTLTLKKQEEIVGGYNPSKYSGKRIWVKARDGAKIPVSLVYNNELYQQGSSPLLLYGYGSYGHSIDPTFGMARLSLLNRGFVFAIAHIRGGEEMGRYWYEDGRQLKKMNTFYDFIDCGKALITEGFSHPNKLFAMGGSAGGLLMGAIINLEPKLWAGVVAAVPFVDVLTTMLDDTIPLTTGEYDEWGNPNIKEYYEYMSKYSPYDNVTNLDYPPMLVTTGLHDSQVQYWEPAKWVAKLREFNSGNNPIYLKTNMDAGHGGATGRFKRFKEIAFEYSFLIYLSKKIVESQNF